jgi:hypothetical protein
MLNKAKLFISLLIISSTFTVSYSFSAESNISKRSTPDACATYAARKCYRFSKSKIYGRCVAKEYDKCTMQK